MLPVFTLQRRNQLSNYGVSVLHCIAERGARGPGLERMVPMTLLRRSISELFMISTMVKRCTHDLMLQSSVFTLGKNAARVVMDRASRIYSCKTILIQGFYYAIYLYASTICVSSPKRPFLKSIEPSSACS